VIFYELITEREPRLLT